MPSTDTVASLRADLADLLARYQRGQEPITLRDVVCDDAHPAVTLRECVGLLARCAAGLEAQDATLQAKDAMLTEALHIASRAVQAQTAAQAQSDKRFDEIEKQVRECLDELTAQDERQHQQQVTAKATRNAERDQRRESVRTTAEDIRRRIPYSPEYSTRWLAKRVAEELLFKLATIRADLDALGLR